MIGHNKGPPLDAPSEDGGYVRLQTWRKAHKQAWRTPSADLVKLRVRGAEALGMTYRDYTAILMDRGRSPRALFFDLAGALVRTRNNEIAEDARGRITLMPGVREKLTGLRDCFVFVVTHQTRIAEGLISRERVEGYIGQVSDLCGGIVSDHAICGEPRGVASALRSPALDLIPQLLNKHLLPPGQACLIGDTVEQEECAMRAGLARFFWAWRYFGEPTESALTT